VNIRQVYHLLSDDESSNLGFAFDEARWIGCTGGVCLNITGLIFLLVVKDPPA
jgi:hypothetical protein